MGVLQGLAANGPYLYAAWKGEPNDNRIFFASWNGSGSWAPASAMPGNTSTGPCLGVFAGAMYAAWKGEWSDPRLFVSKFDGVNWENPAQIPGAYSDQGPALCSLSATQLIAAWKDYDQSLYFASYNGSDWTAPPSAIAGVASSVGPSLAVFNGELYAAWKGEDSDESLWYASYDGNSWSVQNQIAGAASSIGPSLAVFNGELYAAWKGEDSDESLWYASYDGNSWSVQNQIAGAASSIGPSLAVFNGELYAAWKGPDSDVRLYSASFDGITWSAQSNVIPGNTGQDPTRLLPAPAGGNSNYVLSDSGSAALTGLTVTIDVTHDLVPIRRADGSYRFAFQMNCEGSGYSGALPANQAQFVWQQFFFDVDTDVNGQNATLSWWINCFQRQGLTSNKFYSSPRTKLALLPSSRLAQGWQLTMSLTTDQSSNVTGVTFRGIQPDGTPLTPATVPLSSLSNPNAAGPNAGPQNFAPILNVQTIVSGEFNLQYTQFSSGEGFIHTYTTNHLTANVNPSAESGESSNISYSPLPTSYANGDFYQFFGVS